MLMPVVFKLIPTLELWAYIPRYLELLEVADIARPCWAIASILKECPEVPEVNAVLSAVVLLFEHLRLDALVPILPVKTEAAVPVNTKFSMFIN